MQVEVDVKCMQTNFGGCGLSGFGVMAPFCLPSKTAKISLRTMDYSPWSEREIWPFLKVTISPKLKRSCPPKLVCMHLTSLYLHEFFEPIPIN